LVCNCRARLGKHDEGHSRTPGFALAALYTLLLLLATTLVTGLFVWRFTRPIKDLSVAARRVATGDFDVRVPSDRRDEMGALSAASMT